MRIFLMMYHVGASIALIFPYNLFLNGIVTNMFMKILGLVTSPQVAIDAVDMLTNSGEFEDWNEEEFSLWINDIINFHIDMALGYGN